MVEGFIQSQSSSGTHVLPLHDFRPEHEPWRELRLRLVSIQPEPEVILLATAFAPEASSKLELPTQLSDTLELAQGGQHSMVLVVLTPPSIANNEEKIQAFQFFSLLEELAGNIPFLRLIFVQEVTISLYQNQTIATVVDDQICELLYRELLDVDLESTIQGSEIMLSSTISGYTEKSVATRPSAAINSSISPRNASRI